MNEGVALSAEEQAKAVAKKFHELNSGSGSRSGRSPARQSNWLKSRRAVPYGVTQTQRVLLQQLGAAMNPIPMKLGPMR